MTPFGARGKCRKRVALQAFHFLVTKKFERFLTRQPGHPLTRNVLRVFKITQVFQLLSYS